MSTFEELQGAIAALPDATYRVFNSSKAPATEAELVELERQVGRPLSAEHRELLSRWGVLIVEVVAGVWPRPQEGDVLPAWRHGYGFCALGVGAQVPTNLALAPARTPELAALGAVPVLRRFGARWLGVATADGVGTWAPGDPEIESARGDVIDLILAELRALAEGVLKLEVDVATTEQLLARGRAAGWAGPAASDVIDALKQRPADELGPHLAELVALLPAGTFSMGVLDILAVAGPAHFPPVADAVYAHFDDSDAEYVIELLGKLRDVSPGALALYREGFASDEDGVRDRTISVLTELATLPEIRDLAPMLEEHVDDPDRGPAVLGLLGHLGSAAFLPRVRAVLAAAAEDKAFGALLGALEGLAAAVAPLAPELLARARTMAADQPATFNAITALLGLGIEDRAFMEPIARAFHAKGKGWTKRAEALLARWA